MDREFWIDTWNTGKIGFHQATPTPLLVEHRGVLDACARIYVPLCGKSLDLPYLRSLGHRVFGTELSPLAINDFFAALGEKPTVTEHAPFRVHESNGVTVFEGDAFALTPDHLGGPVDAIYDRASLVAVEPKSQRRLLVESFRRVLAPAGRILLIGFEYDQSKADGPPWSVNADEVERLFSSFGSIKVLGKRQEVVSPRLAAAGVSALEETLYAIGGP